MLRRSIWIFALVLLSATAAGIATTQIILPTGWRLTPPQGAMATIGTMPQGLSLSPDGKTLAVVESGRLPAQLRLLESGSLRELASIPLKGAFGSPVWTDANHVLIAGAGTDSALLVDARANTLSELPIGPGTWPAAVAVFRNVIATANDGDGSVSIGALHVPVGAHPSAVQFSRDGKTLYVAVRATNSVQAIDTKTGVIRASIQVGLHPAALALSSDGSRLYVAESDDDSVGIVDTATNWETAHIPVGLNVGRISGHGASPNALFARGADLFVTLGAENAVALIRNGHVVERIPAGWYPTGVTEGSEGTLYVSNGKGEHAPANVQFHPFAKNWSSDYIANITVGSIRAIPKSAYSDAKAASHEVLSNAAPQWSVHVLYNGNAPRA